jgi:predicted Zn-dependent protease
VAFAEVQSFIRFFVREAGDEALPKLLVKMREAEETADLDKAIAEVSGTDFAGWDKRWRTWLSSAPRELPPDAMPGGKVPNIREIARRVRLGQLLGERNHHRHAATSLGKAQALIPNESSVRCMLAASLLAAGDSAGAAPVVEKVEDIRSGFGRWWSLHGLLHPQRADLAFREALALDPLDPWVACQEKAAPEVPKDAISAAICEAARRVPR